MWSFLQVLAGGALALIGAYFGNRGNVKASDRRWLAAEKSKHSARTAERLGRLYSPLVQSAATIQSVAYEKQYVTTRDGTIEKRDERHVHELSAAYILVTRIGGELLIDKDARPIRELYNSFRKKFDEYITALEFESPGVDRAKKVEELRQQLSKLALEIQEFAENHLDELNAVPTLND